MTRTPDAGQLPLRPEDRDDPQVRPAGYWLTRAGPQGTRHAITGVTAAGAGASSFQVAEDQTADLVVGQTLRVNGSSGNDGLYTLRAGSSFAGGTTTVNVSEAVPDATADGALQLFQSYPAPDARRVGFPALRLLDVAYDPAAGGLSYTVPAEADAERDWLGGGGYLEPGSVVVARRWAGRWWADTAAQARRYLFVGGELTSTGTRYRITAHDTEDQVTVSGDLTSLVSPGQTIFVVDDGFADPAPANRGPHVVQSVSPSGPDTVIGLDHFRRQTDPADGARFLGAVQLDLVTYRKLDAHSGATVWSGDHGADVRSTAAAPDGSYYFLSGDTAADGNNFRALDSSGGEQWTLTDAGGRIDADASHVLVGGSAGVRKYTHAGSLAWTVPIAGASDVLALDGYVAVGRQHPNTDVAEVYLFDSAGTQLWMRQLGGLNAFSANTLLHVDVNASGQVVAALQQRVSGSSPNSQSIADLYAFDVDGNQLWSRRWAFSRLVRGVAVDADGASYEIGQPGYAHSNKRGAGSPAELGDTAWHELRSSIRLRKRNAAGEPLWVAPDEVRIRERNGRTSGTTSNRNVEWPEDLAVDEAGRVYVAGQEHTATITRSLEAYDRQGRRLWSRNWGRPSIHHFSRMPKALAVAVTDGGAD